MSVFASPGDSRFESRLSVANRSNNKNYQCKRIERCARLVLTPLNWVEHFACEYRIKIESVVLPARSNPMINTWINRNFHKSILRSSCDSFSSNFIQIWFCFNCLCFFEENVFNYLMNLKFEYSFRSMNSKMQHILFALISWTLDLWWWKYCMYTRSRSSNLFINTKNIPLFLFVSFRKLATTYVWTKNDASVAAAAAEKDDRRMCARCVVNDHCVASSRFSANQLWA